MDFFHKQWSKAKFNSLSKKKRLLVIAAHLRDLEQTLLCKSTLSEVQKKYKKASLYLDYLEVTLPSSSQILLEEIKEGVKHIDINTKNTRHIIRKLNDYYFQLLSIAGITISDYEFLEHNFDNAARALKSSPWPIYIILDNLRSPFNIGSIFRTADAVRVSQILLCGFSVCPPHRKLERASMGATHYVSWKYFDKTEDAIAYVKQKHIPVIGLETISHAPYYFNFRYPTRAALIIGNEELGIAGTILDQCDYYIQIPRYGYKNSINVSSATSIVLYEMVRQYLACEE
ncbi:MAG: RNA methyltransferase [bacterium]